MYPRKGDMIRIERSFRVWAINTSDSDKLDHIVGDIPPVLTLYLSPGDLCIVLDSSKYEETPIHNSLFEMKMRIAILRCKFEVQI